jgi:hypothetical protein
MGVCVDAKMKFFVSAHQHKGRPYHAALKAAGHISLARHADVALYDREWYVHIAPRLRPIVQEQVDRGAVIMVYPHSALPPWWYDGDVKVHPCVSCVFVIGKGQKEAMKTIDPAARVEITGWPWSTQRPFRASKEVKRILFAPIHPAGGRLRSEAVQANKDIYRELKRTQAELKCKVTVRYIHELELQGLRPYSRFEWVEGRPDGSTTEIDQADVVIAEGTFLYLSVAQGKPTIGINQHIPVRPNKPSGTLKEAPANWEKYGPEIAYPINFGSKPLLDLIELATNGEQSEWRNRFIGKSLDPYKFSAMVEDIWRESSPK